MKKPALLIFQILVSFFAVAQSQSLQPFYVGTFTSEGGTGIQYCELNSETGKLSLIETFKGLDNPAFLSISKDNRFLYAVAESSEGYVLAFEILGNGKLRFINKQFSNGDGPCFVDVSNDGKWVAVANYGGGTVSLFPVEENGALQPASSVIVNKGSGPDKSRQEKPHAHSARFSPFSNTVFSADLGTDHVDIFDLENGKLVQSSQPFIQMEPGAGPRHIEFHPSGKTIYIINELNSTITSLSKVGEKWESGESVSTLPIGFNGKSYCADIHISADAKYLYASNRGHNSVSVFEITVSGLKLKTNVPVEGNWPRNFTLSPDGKYLLIANQRSGNVTVFRIDKNTGIPVFIGYQLKIKSPVCIKFLNR